jgi:hypothetical protein
MSTELARALQSIAFDLLKFFLQIALPLAILASASFIGWLWINTQKPEESARLKTQIAPTAKLIGTYTLVILTILASSRIISSVNSISNARLRAKLSQISESRSAQDIGPIYQSGPSVAYRKEKSYERTLRLPSDIFNQIGQQGASVLAPYLGDPGSENVTELKDVFKQSGNELFVTRTVTRIDEELVPVEKASVNINANSLPNSQPATRAYTFNFDSNFTFKNSESTAQTMRFTFPQPSQQGALADFTLTVDNQKITEPNEYGYLVWEDEVPAGKTLQATVKYNTQGSRTIDYSLASDRRIIKDFELKFSTNMPHKITQGAVLPYTSAGSTKTWKLNNVLTASDLGISFFATDGTGYLLAKILGFAPILLILITASLMLGKIPVKSILSVLLIQSTGLVLIPALTPYTTLAVATIGAVTLSLGLTLAMLKREFTPAIAIITCLPFAFLTKTHAGIIIATAMLVILLLHVLKQKQASTPSQS